MANFYRSVLALALLTGSSSLLAFEITGETFSVEGTVTGVELTANGGTINAVGNAGRYGKVFLTWNCLLYTSPSPRDRTRSRMPSSA